ncbi:T9SS type A sorting domain-containing protein [Hymenobacter busanensis]|uniref:T9SS type A sorting domain-containing protein n=1 Tax=Hymenobacter busanensis TaxID=2607656 RepID=A0A7L5A1K3_9BACT|nr:T9SS type A sorting domain-containing protein [Hymenobacter busanensis]KAA9338177.1 T9SS type A sorting domain-containing protein [Hymenobacter busanensis]QHJ09398.1 T9SS type A sorting domain-containing protein [Hymenobacter busanensis]
MKRLLLPLLAFLTLGASASVAQTMPVPQGTLENWVTRNGAEAPQGWQTTDDLIAGVFGLPITSGTVAKSTDKHGGTFAAKLETKTAPLIGTVPGLLILGNSLNLSSDFPGGAPFTSRPANMQFYYKLAGASAVADSASISVFLTKTTAGVTQEVAYGDMYFRQLASSYTLATVPLTYSSAVAPDSIRILISTGDANTITVGTSLLIDDVVMTGTATPARDAKHTDNLLAVYPNPSTGGKFALDARQQPALLNAAYTVTDITGRTVLQQAATTGASTRTIDLSNQPAGIYTLRVAAAEGSLVRRLIVR